MKTEIAALEYREEDWPSTSALVERVASVADACAAAGLSAVGMASWFRGQLAPPVGASGRSVIFGLRAQSVQAAFGVADMLSMRGYSGVYTWTEEVDDQVLELGRYVLAGMGMVRARGGHQVLYGRSLAEVREALEAGSTVDKGRASRWEPELWMPAVDRLDRAVDGVFLEEAARRAIDLVWAPGDGINRFDSNNGAAPGVVRARVDEGGHSAQLLARWAAGDRVGRSRLRVADLADAPRRWLREVVGWR